MKYLVLFLLVCGSIFSQSDKDSEILYSKNPKLTWKMFKASAPPVTIFAAAVNTGIGFTWSYSTKEGKIDLQHDVIAYTQPNFSWVIEKEKKPELLKHEQLHFDITELHARIFRKKLAEYKFTRNIRRAMNKIYSDVELERVKMQELYDKESEHSKNRKQQLIWELKVANLLLEHKDYSK